MSKIVKSFEIEQKALELKFPPVKIENWLVEPRFKLTSNELVPGPDYAVEIEWENKFYKFVAEINTLGTPKTTFETVGKVKRYASAIDAPEKYYPLIIAPYFSEDILEYLISEKVSGLDLSGNGVLYVPNRIFIYKTGAENKYPSNAPIKNVFRGVSSLVGRVFLARPEYSAVGEVLEEIQKLGGDTTFSTVSKVLKTLEEDLIISRKNGIRLVDGRRLLKNLRENYQKPASVRIVRGKVKSLENSLAKMSDNADEADILFAIDEPQRYVVFPSNTVLKKVYTEDIDKTLKEVGFSKDERFPNIELIGTKEPTIYFDRRWDIAEGVYYTSPVQIYLELANGGKREKETAEQMAGNILNFEYR